MISPNFSTQTERPEPSAENAREINKLLEILPVSIREAIHSPAELVEIVLDMGQKVEVRYAQLSEMLDLPPVTLEDLQQICQGLSPFGDDNRAGLEGTLHRVSALKNRTGEIVGLTCRVGRASYGSADIIRDLLKKGDSILLLGVPGIGKTTMLRECARILSTEMQKRVMIVDTSNEIAGDGNVAHIGVGNARRMQVPHTSMQSRVMIEAVENHMPEVIIVDEIGNAQEAAAARTIAERGVQLIATAHGQTLSNLLVNPHLNDLVGGVHTVTLGDTEAEFRGTSKSVRERKAPPAFGCVVELQSREKVAIHSNVEKAVDSNLRGFPSTPELRLSGPGGQIVRRLEEEYSPEDELYALPFERTKPKSRRSEKRSRGRRSATPRFGQAG